jgi:signal transduction histidine kinase
MTTRKRQGPDNRGPVKPPAVDVNLDALEKARLFEEAERRTRETTALLEVSRVVASSLDLSEVLGAILDQLGAITEHTGASILLIRDDAFEFAAARSITEMRAQIGARIPSTVGSGLGAAMKRGEIVIIDDVRADEPLAADYRAVIRSIGVPDQPPFNVIRSWMSVPLALKDRVLGALTISWTAPAYFTTDHARLARAFADQASIAIENARLYEQAQQLAATEERQRLARELHDSVSQALYGIALGARTARTLLDRDPPAAVEPVDYILSLAEVGLAEMRALIFELRPESLESEGLNAAIRKQVEAVQARHGIQVDFLPCEEPDLPLAVKEAAYRIAQESLTNVVKHSQATQVRVILASTDAGLELEVADNGTGFDTAGDFPGHLGLRSMRERAEKSGGRLEISSQAGVGTRVIATFAAR